MRARADGAVVDGRDPGRREDRRVGDHLHADRLQRLAGDLRVDSRSAREQRMSRSISYGAADEAQVEVDVAARLGGDLVEQRAVLGLDRLERVAGRPAARADEAAARGQRL